MKKTKLLLSLVTGLLAFTATGATLQDNPVPVHRPIIEEYTGTWCGYCVRGYVGMELLRETFGDQFIGVAIHTSDPMAVLSSANFPNSIDGVPSAFLDRTDEVDPFWGFSGVSGGIVSDMQQYAALETFADVFVTASWTSEDKTDVAVNVTSYFTVDDNSGNYAIEIMLIADDLYGSGSDWDQENYYSNWWAYRNDPYLGPWVRKPEIVSGLHFNDVLIGTSGVVTGSLPNNIVAYTEYNYNYTLRLSQLPNPSLVQNKDNLHLIVVVVNKNTRKAINANRCFISDYVPFIYGDVNNDGFVNIGDVTALINYVLSNEIPANGDMNGDGLVNIGDVTTLINYVLTGSVSN